jgi:hypothetical protein
MDLSGIGNGLTREERETTIILNDQDDVIEISTASPVMARKLAKLAEAYGVALTINGPWDVRATLPIKCLSLRAPRAPREISDAERDRMRARLAHNLHRTTADVA